MRDLQRYSGINVDDIAGHAAALFANPIAIIGFVVICFIWARSKRSNGTLTMLLSVLAITMTQLVLMDGARSDAATQAKLDALLQATPARDALVRAEERSVAEIEELRR